MSYILSPEQKVVADAIRHQTSSDIKYFDITVAFQAITEALISAIKEGKTTQINIPDDTLRHDISNLLARCGLGELSIDLASDDPALETDIVNLRTILKKKVDTAPIIAYQISKNQLIENQNQVLNYFLALDKKVLSDMPFRELTRSLIYKDSITKPNIQIPLNLNFKLDFSSKEFYSLKKEIQNASQLYEAQFELFDNLTLLNEDIWQWSSEKKQEATLALKTYKNKAKELSKSYTQTYNNLRKKASQTLDLLTESLDSKLNAHEESCISYHINTKYSSNEESKFSLFGKKQKAISNKIYVDAFDELSGLIKEISSYWYEAIDAPTTEDIDYVYISKFIKNVREAQQVYVSQIGSSLDNSIHRINRINTTSEEVLSLDSQLTELISEIDTSLIFATSFGSNTLSYTKQMELISQIETYLSNCEVLLGDTSKYTQWKTFIGTCNGTIERFIQQIKTEAKDQWGVIFEDWYFEQMTSTILNSADIDDMKMDALMKLKHQNLTSSVPAVINQLQNSRLLAAEELKTSSKELYNTLFKKKALPTTSWNNMALMSRPFLKSVFPIHITSNLSYISDYDQVLSFSRRPEIFEDKTKVHYISPIEANDIENRQDNTDLFLYLNHYEYGTRLDELSKTDKLKAAKKIAKYILSLNQQVKIYQLKSANIISLLPVQDDIHFANSIAHLGVNAIDTDGVLYERLTESILFTERNPYLIIKDQMINPELHSFIYWQLNVLELLKSAGYRILSVNTCDQLTDNKAVFDELIQKLSPSDTMTQVEIAPKPTTESTILTT